MKQAKSTNKSKFPRWAKRFSLIVIVLLIILGVAGLFARHQYFSDLEPADPSGHSVQVNIAQGSSASSIAMDLQDKGIINSKWSFEIYVTRSDARDKLKAGTYKLSPAMNVGEIVSILTHGRVATHLVTIIPGSRIDQVRATLIDAGFDEAAVDKALKPSTYLGNPALVDKPKGASLEGFLYPDSFAKDSHTLPDQIVKESLDEMADHLTPDLRAAYTKHGLNVYQAITLASMVEQEASKPADRNKVAQVFMKRLSSGSMLGSDVTALYGAIKSGHSDLSQRQQLQLDTPYNTLMHKGLPPGPISNVSDSSLRAVAHPAKTDYLYFVAGDNGQIYFSHSLAQHEQQIAQHCHKLCNVE